MIIVLKAIFRELFPPEAAAGEALRQDFLPDEIVSRQDFSNQIFWTIYSWYIFDGISSNRINQDSFISLTHDFP